MTNIHKQRGRPKGDKPAMTPAERMARTRRRREIYKEECEKAGIVYSTPYLLDKSLLSVFEGVAEDTPDIAVEELIFLAMREFAKKHSEKPEKSAFSKVWKEHIERAGIEDISKFLAVFNLAKINTSVRLLDEGLLEPNQSEDL